MKRLTVEENRKLLVKLVKDKFIFDENEYTKAISKINFTCKKCGNTFQRTLGNYKRSNKCPYCENKRHKRTQEEFINEMFDVWGHRLDLSKAIYKTIDDKVTLICNKHNTVYQQTAYHALKGQCGCKKCENEKFRLSTSKPIQYFQDKIGEKFGDKISLMKRDETNISYGIFWCREHNLVFKQFISHAINGVISCPKCVKKYIQPNMGNHNLVDSTEFKKVYSKKFPNLDLNKVEFRTMSDEIVVTCKKHGEFKTRPSYLRNSKHGCPTCASEYIAKRYHRVPTWLYYVSLEYGGKTFYKIGITSGKDILKHRFAGKRYSKLNIKVLLSIRYNDGYLAYQEEQKYLKKFSKFIINEDEWFLRSGNTEVFNTDVFNLKQNKGKI